MVSARDLAAGERHFAAEKQEERDNFLTTALIKALKLDRKSRDGIYEDARREGRRRPRITNFRSCYPDFPVYIAVRDKVTLQKSAGLKMLFPLKRALTLPFVTQFNEMLEEELAEIEGRASVLLLSWPGKMPVAVHNIRIPAGQERVCYHIDDGKNTRLTIEPIESFVSLLEPHEGAE